MQESAALKQASADAAAMMSEMWRAPADRRAIAADAARGFGGGGAKPSDDANKAAAEAAQALKDMWKVAANDPNGRGQEDHTKAAMESPGTTKAAHKRDAADAVTRREWRTDANTDLSQLREDTERARQDAVDALQNAWRRR